jgi:(2Fe-2S) ferredoxin
MHNKGFQGVTTQQIYQQHKIYPEDSRSIAQALNLGNEPFKPSAVQQIIGFSQQAKANHLTLKQAIVQYRQVQSDPANQDLHPPESPENVSLPIHLQSLLIQSADRAQQELETLDRIIYEQVELPAAQAAVQRVLASDVNIEYLMVKLLREEIKTKPGRLGGLVLQAVGHFRTPTLQGTEMRYRLPSSGG